MKAIRNQLRLAIGLFFLLLRPFAGFSQNEIAWFNNLSSEDSAAINALVLYPDSIRLSIFEACKYPEVIVRMSVLQSNTSDNFTNLISKYSHKEQEELWNLTRYPGLISALVTGGKKTKDEINTILKNYPDEVHDDALNYGRNYFDVLQQMDQLYKESDQSFENILRGYPPSAQDAFHDLVDLPEVLSILNDHMQMTVLVGDMYRRNPEQLIKMADSLNLVVAQQNAQELADWQKTVESDPNAQKDLQNASLDYAQQNCDYDEETCTRPNTTDYVDNYVCYPYPYWFGYPYWYPYYYWYPYPYWYDWGFYFNPYGGMVFIGLPSYYFTYWYFYYPSHYYNYPYLCNTYVGYYYGPRRVVSDNTNVVRGWVDDNRGNLPHDFASNSTNRVDVIKQLGHLETDYQNSKATAKGNTASRDEFLKKNQQQYPSLSPSKENPADKNQPQISPQQKNPPVKQPPVTFPKAPQQQQQKPTPPKYDFEKVNPAQQHHRNTWEQSRPSQQSVPRNSAPSAPRQAPSQPRQAPSKPGPR